MREANEFAPERIRAAPAEHTTRAEKATQLRLIIRSYGGAIAAVDAMEQWLKRQRL